MAHKNDQSSSAHYHQGLGFSTRRELSLPSLILWNIDQVFEKNSTINIKSAMQTAFERLSKECDVRTMLAQQPEDQHLACAVLAWQRLGHGNVDSLHEFVVANRAKAARIKFRNGNEQCAKVNEDGCERGVASASFGTSSSIGPIVRLPVETKIVMRMDNPCARHQPKKQQKNQKDIMNKIDAACCMDSACMQRLTELGSSTDELRKRAGRLARREAERVELLERAEAAWRDLEAGYQRRLKLAQEKEEDILKQINKMIEDRTAYKNITTNLAKKLKERGEAAEKEKNRLTQLEKEVCNKACERLRLSEQAAQGDAAVAELQCRAVQLDRELLYKEDQARRRVLSLEGEVDSTRGLTIEAERAMRSELSALKQQITEVSNQLLIEEADNNRIKAELEQMRQEKSEIIQDLDGCKDMCDSRMQKRIDELKKKREQLLELKNRVIECQCKLPQDVAVEAKRTPSLAALCHCTPEDKILDSCSCMSLRSQLLSNLLSDLFGGLQAELGSITMPCQLLKCLEDRHDWDRASVVKTNLRNYFSQLLIGELDIAIATAIEKYHARWVGASCADVTRLIPDPGEQASSGWQERAIERRAQKLASELAEQLFKERADEITQKAKDIMTSGPPPCECKPQHNAAVYPCLVKTPIHPNTSRKTSEGPSSYLKRTIHDVSVLKSQIENLKKDSINKEDLRHMEEKLARIIQRASKPDAKQVPVSDSKIMKNDIYESKNKLINKASAVKNKIVDAKKSVKSNKLLSYNQSGRIEKNTYKFPNKKKGQSLAVNLCLCPDQNDADKVNFVNRSPPVMESLKPKLNNDIVSIPISASKKLSAPIAHTNAAQKSKEDTKKERSKACPSECICLHKAPSNTSLDQLLDALKKWKYDLNNFPHINDFKNNEIGLPIEDKNSLKQFVIIRESINEKIGKSLSKSPSDQFNNLPQGAPIVTKQSKECLPVHTRSEYMGAVNLDKSNDNKCKCIMNEENIRNKSITGDWQNSQNIKCINTSKCKCNKSVENLDNDGLSNLYTNKSQLYSVKFPCSNFAKSVIKNQETDAAKIESFINIKSPLLSMAPNNDIKFLGVTLHNIERRSIKSTDVSQKNLKCAVKMYNNNIPEENDKDDLKIEDKVHPKDTANNNTARSSLIQIKTPVKESCVCCKNNEETNELELNTFNLLEEYLKGKLQKFKNTNCQSSCIPPEDEEKLYTATLAKVKDLIFKQTDIVSCKCSLGYVKEGNSWSRAYGLLQEYLTIKMKRVECSCFESKQATSQDKIVPSVLDKIRNLIESDFKRLENLCRCKEKDIIEKPLLPKISCGEKELIPENDCNNLIYPNAKEDTSISAKPSMLNKSCSAINSLPAYVQMVEKVTSCKLNSHYVTDCDCRYTLTEPYPLGDSVNVHGQPGPKTCDTDALYINPNTENMKAKDDKSNQKLPYIGYTLNCSCDHFGCVCTKSQLPKREDKINFIWNTLTSENHPKRLSYIMHAVPKVRSEVINISEDYLNLLLSQTYVCDNLKSTMNDNEDIENETHQSDKLEHLTQTSLNEDDGLTLKDSTNVVDKKNNDSNTIDCASCQILSDPGPSCASSISISNACGSNDIDSNKNNLLNSLYLPVGNCSQKNVVLNNSDINLSKTSCECKMVPMCHVKMLIDNIGNNLKNCKCTCDALCSQVCPIHSKSNF